MAWLWAVVGVVVATTLVIAYLMDRRVGTGIGMTDRDRLEAGRALRDLEDRCQPWSDTGTGS